MARPRLGSEQAPCSSALRSLGPQQPHTTQCAHVFFIHPHRASRSLLTVKLRKAKELQPYGWQTEVLGLEPDWLTRSQPLWGPSKSLLTMTMGVRNLKNCFTSTHGTLGYLVSPSLALLFFLQGRGLSEISLSSDLTCCSMLILNQCFPREML